MNKIDYTTLNVQSESEHITGLEKEKLIPLTITKDYNYRITKPLMRVFAVMLNLLALLVMPVWLFLQHGLVIKGSRNLKQLKKSGAISIANHVLPLDGAMVAQSMFPKRVIFHSLEDNFKIPFTRHLIKALGCIPIPNSITAKPSYIKATTEFLKEGKIVQIYPEAALWPNYNKIRAFKTGAFHFAVKNNVPIIPICINFRQPKGLEKYLPNKNNLVTLHIGKPIYPNLELPFKESVEQLLQKSHKNLTRMNHYFKLLDHQKVLEKEMEKEEII